VLSATQAANGNYGTATQNTSFTVSAEVPLLVFAPIASQNTDSLPFPVSASSPSTGAITYSVTSGPPTMAGSTVTQTGTGTVTLSANQAAAGSYAATIATVSFVVSQGFTLSPAPGTSSGSATIAPSGAANYSMVLTPGTGTIFPNAMTFTVTGLPPGATATFSPSTIAAGSGPKTVILTIQISSSHALIGEKPLPLGSAALFAFGLLFPLLGMKRTRGRQLRHLPVVVLMLLGTVTVLSGCGTTGPSYSSPQSYTMTVTVTDMTTGAHSSTNLALTVQ
jgi:hypothetical protein